MDTNALHFLLLYLNYSRNECLYPFNMKETSYATNLAVLRATLKRNPTKALFSSLQKGINIAYFLDRTEYQVEYSPISEMELIRGRARGKAIQIAAIEGVSDRIWSRFGGDEVRKRLSLQAMEQLSKTISNLKMLPEVTRITAPSRALDGAQAAWQIAIEISPWACMDVQDCIIYASAIVSGAEYIVTADRYFRKVINRLSNPSCEEERVIKKEILNIVFQYSLFSVEETSVPSGVNPRDLPGKADDILSVRGS